MAVGHMRILQLHSDSIEYLPVQKESPVAEEAERKPVKLEEVAVLFVSVEKGDDEEVVERAAEETKSDLESVGANRALIYPYSHLSGDLESPGKALEILRKLESRVREKGIEAHRAPFGWNKKFAISVKGHPLAERLRIVAPGTGKSRDEGKVSAAIESEKKLSSSWYVVDLEGKLVPVDKFDFGGFENLRKFARYEMAKARAAKEEPPHIALMKRLEISNYEPASDAGNLRWAAKGRFVKSLLERYVTEKTLEYGAMEIETPIMYDFEHPCLADYLNRFPARQYVLKSDDKEYFLRFSACFGQFLMARDMNMSYKHLPVKIYELTRYSFRRE
ncbi:MAG: threonyl-tRNA synthetase editing domain-containing protein, partial [Thermoproteota archaeon]